MGSRVGLAKPSETQAARSAMESIPMATWSRGERDSAGETAQSTYDSRLAKPHVNWSFATTPIFASRDALRIQPKLQVGAVDDPLEREADNAADQVMRTSDSATAAGSVLSGAPSGLQRKCDCGGSCPKCQEESVPGVEALRLKSTAAENRAGMPAPASVHEVLRSPGQPLEPATRAFMQSQNHRRGPGGQRTTRGKASGAPGADAPF